jgi:hypothetical protein
MPALHLGLQVLLCKDGQQQQPLQYCAFSLRLFPIWCVILHALCTVQHSSSTTCTQGSAHLCTTSAALHTCCCLQAWAFCAVILHPSSCPALSTHIAFIHTTSAETPSSLLLPVGVDFLSGDPASFKLPGSQLFHIQTRYIC